MRYVGQRVRVWIDRVGWTLGTVHTTGPPGVRPRVWLDEPGRASYLVRPREHPWHLQGLDETPALPPSTYESEKD